MQVNITFSGDSDITLEMVSPPRVGDTVLYKEQEYLVESVCWEIGNGSLGIPYTDIVCVWTEKVEDSNVP